MTDEELVLLAKQGDTSAFDQLVVRHQSAVFRAAFAALRVREDAEEATQDALLRAWSSLSRFRGDSSFRTWLLTIAWRRALSRRRGVMAWLRRLAPIDDDMPLRSAWRSDDRVKDAELRGHIAAAIEALSPKLRDTLLLVQSGEYSYEDVAAMLRVPLGTVKFRVSDARRRIRERLAKLGYVDAR